MIANHASTRTTQLRSPQGVDGGWTSPPPAVDPLPQIAEYTRGRTPDVPIIERNGVDVGDQSFPFSSLTLMVLWCHQECERHFEGVVNLAAVEAKREAFAHARKGGHDAIATRR